MTGGIEGIGGAALIVPPPPRLEFPTSQQHLYVCGQNGTGKTVAALDMVSSMPIDIMPYVYLDAKNDDGKMLVKAGAAKQWSIHSKPPKDAGLYVAHFRMGIDEEAVSNFCIAANNMTYCGIIIDEGALINPNNPGVRMGLCTGRSKHNPYVFCSQRPRKVTPLAKSEAWFYRCFRLATRQDEEAVREFVPGAYQQDLDPWCSFYYEARRQPPRLSILGPGPKLPEVIRKLKARQGIGPSRKAL